MLVIVVNSLRAVVTTIVCNMVDVKIPCLHFSKKAKNLGGEDISGMRGPISCFPVKIAGGSTVHSMGATTALI